MKAGMVVRRYAKALFAIAREKDLIQDLGREADFLQELFADPALQGFLASPRISSMQKRDMVVAKIGQHVSDTMKNFVSLLFDRKREGVLLGIGRAYRDISQKTLGEADGTVEAAVKPSDKEIQSLAKSLSERLGLKVSLSFQENKDLLGGLRVTVGHRRMDASVAAQMKKLRNQLLSTRIGKA